MLFRFRLPLFFLSVFFTGIMWIIIVPIWHTPDEQAHFGQVAFMAEKGRNPKNQDKYDLTEEIYISEKLLGTYRDKFGNNKFTFHPEYKIEYTDGLTGKYEASIAALARTDAPKKFVHQESTRYPPLYYIPASLIFKIFYQSDLFTRVFAVRLFSLSLFISTVYISYKMGKLLFPESRLAWFILTILVGFQPMMVFANIGVTSDALGNLLFTFFLYLCSGTIIKGVKRKTIILLVITIILSIYTKPQFIVMIPLVAILSVYIIWRQARDKNKHKSGMIVSFVVVLLVLGFSVFQKGPVSIVFTFFRQIDILSLVKYSWEYTLPHTVKEVLPWYFGVYKWLGVTYPRIVHRIINRLIILAGLGFIWWVFKVIKQKKFLNREIQAMFFLLFTSFIFFIGVSLFDWLSWYAGKYPLGVQGRYFFPVITTHMLVFLLGFRAILPKKRNIRQRGLAIAAFLMIAFNIYALYLVADSYYDLSSVSSFIASASQYKPWFVKGNFLYLWSLAYLVFLALGVIIPLVAIKDR